MSPEKTSYKESILEKQIERERRLTENDRGWLCLTGLFHLKDGRNTFGSDPSNDLVLPGAGIPPRVATFILQNGVVTVKAAMGAPISVDGKAVTSMLMQSDQDDNPTYLNLGNQITMLIIKRGTFTLIRVWDKNHPNRQNFSGLRYYPADPDFCIKGVFIPYEQPKIITITDIIGSTYDVSHPGYVSFKVGNQECRLDAVAEDDSLFFNFRDLTNGEVTYPGGRMMLAEKDDDNQVTLDFNLAYNPPCAYTDYATCPIPPEENRLAVRIEAGEKNYPRPH